MPDNATPPPIALPQSSRRRWPWFVAGALALGAAGWLHYHSAATPNPGAISASATGPGGRGFGGAGRVQPVSVGTVQRRDIRVSVSAIGNIAAANTAVVHPQVDGELKAIYFTEGQAVRAGQVLALIDPRPFQIAVTQAQGQLARDQAQLHNAQLDLQRYRDLLAKDAAPKQQVDTQEALVQQLQGTVLSDQAALDNAKLQLSYTRVVAPISGLAGLKQADLGNIVHASDANGLLTIAQTQPVNLVFAVPDASLPRIRQQLAAGAPLRVEAWDREQKRRLATGQVASTDNAIDPATGTIRVKAMFPNTDSSLFPNQFVNVRLQLDTLAGVLAVPSAAVQRGAVGSFVYAVAEDGTVHLRKLTTSATDGDWVAVDGELQPGEKVVTDGADRLRDGAKVEVIAAPAKAGSAEGRSGRRHAVDGVAGAASAPAGAGSAAGPVAAPAGERPRWMDRVPPEMVDKLKAMSPEERRAWFEKQRGGAN